MDTQHLGKNSALPASPEEAVLDYVPNPKAGALYLVRFAAPEFTSLCPVTGQPDFAHLVIDYAPGETIVESKSLKLFLGSFRSHWGFHEDVTVGIGQRLVGRAARGPVAARPGRRCVPWPRIGSRFSAPARSAVSSAGPGRPPGFQSASSAVPGSRTTSATTG
jgi:7-cyano-7-deazaguanine reductase